MGNQHLKDLRGESRRRFLKWSSAIAAAVGVDRAGYLNFLADEGGHGTADAALSKALRSVHLVSGNGVFAWFQLLWPHTEVGKATGRHYNGNSPSGKLAYYGALHENHVVHNPATNYPAVATGVDGVNHEFYYSKYAPWMEGTGVDRKPKKGMEVTGIMAGRDETHTQFPVTAAKISGKADLIAGIAAIQVKEGTAIAPVIGTDPFEYGKAPGAPDRVTVPGANGLIDLFNSAASQFSLANEKDKHIFETYYKAFAGLRKAAPRSSTLPHLEVTKNAARLIGQNFASQLTPSATDLQNYGISNILGNGSLMMEQRKGLDDFGRMMITCGKALALGLTNCCVVSISPTSTSDVYWTDPHEVINSTQRMQQGLLTTQICGQILDAFYNYLGSIPDPENGGFLSDHTMLTSHGDTAHTPLEAGAWPDATPDACNWIYVVGKGYIKTGWFGRVQVLANQAQSNTTMLFDPKTGSEYKANGKNSSILTQAAGGAIAYAAAKGDSNLVSGDLGAPKVNYQGLIAPAT